MAKQPENKNFSAIAVKDNLASIAVMKKLGMQYIKTYSHTDSPLGDVDVVLYRIENNQTRKK
jgi:RimJ/RimL family protein N-acetyltransferase